MQWVSLEILSSQQRPSLHEYSLSPLKEDFEVNYGIPGTLVSLDVEHNCSVDISY